MLCSLCKSKHPCSQPIGVSLGTYHPKGFHVDRLWLHSAEPYFQGICEPQFHIPCEFPEALSEVGMESWLKKQRLSLFQPHWVVCAQS